MSEKTKHTPTPWATGAGMHPADQVFNTEGAIVADCKWTNHDPARREENAAFIVKACNEYEGLLQAAKNALQVIEEAEAMEWEKGGAETIPQAEELRQAIQRATT